MKKSLKGNSVISVVLGTQIQNAHSDYVWNDVLNEK